MYRNSFDCLKKTVSLYGFKGLYRGIQFPLIGSIAENGLTFVSYSFCKRLLGVKDPDSMTMTQLILSSMGSGASISFLLTPVELLKCHLQIEQSYNNDPTKPKLTTMGVIRKVTRDNGIRGLFRGLNMTLIREVPGTSIWFVVYEMALRPFIHHGYSRNSIPMKGVITAGAISGATYWCLVYPIDTIKSIIQTDPLYAEQMKNSQCLWKDRARYMYSVVKRLGIRGLYSGLGFTMFRAIPTNAILFVSYEYVARLLRQFF
ncbi:hypothetical protein WA588_003558 [Blastocystis sp. NMH]